MHGPGRRLSLQDKVAPRARFPKPARGSAAPHGPDLRLVAKNKTLWRVQFPHGANISREACERLWAARPRLIFDSFEGADGYMIPLLFPEGHPGNEPIPWESLSGPEGPGSGSDDGSDGDD